jgi:4-amino-4-deoxy-L-arabinose transferase-like glycosyltransferase
MALKLTPSGGARFPIIEWLVLLAVASVLYLPGTGTIPLMDRDEPRFAHATVEMMQRGSWSIPYFNGEYRFDKPPLTYWWMCLNYHLMGVNELAARLHGVLAVFLTALAVGGLARRVSRAPYSGLVAGTAWLTNLQSLVHGRLCVADMPMILCVTLACRALVELLMCEGPHRRWSGWFWCLWLSLAGGFLAKGPIALLVPALSLVLWRWFIWRRPAPWGRLQMAAGLCLALVLVAAWGVPALIETKGAFWRTGMGEHVVKRGTDVFNGRKFVPGFYLLTTWLSLFPWLCFALPVWHSLRTNWTAKTTFMAAWFLAPQVIFFFYATQLPHYVMPGYPAFIVLLALAWENRRRYRIPKLAKWLVAALAVIVTGGWICAQAVQVTSSALSGLMASGLLVLASALVLGGVAACFVWKNGMCGRSAWLACAAMLLTGAGLIPLGQALRSSSIPVCIAEQLDCVPASVRLHGCGYSEPSLVFYTDRMWQFTDDVPSAQTLLESPSPAALVVLNREWTLDKWFKALLGMAPAGLPAKDHSIVVAKLCENDAVTRTRFIEGFNVARFSWAEVVLIVKD